MILTAFSHLHPGSVLYTQLYSWQPLLHSPFHIVILLQDNWFDETDDSADESVGSPVIAPQTWKVHQGLGAGDAHSSGITNAAFVDDESVSGHSLPQYTFDASVPDEF